MQLHKDAAIAATTSTPVVERPPIMADQDHEHDSSREESIPLPAQANEEPLAARQYDKVRAIQQLKEECTRLARALEQSQKEKKELRDSLARYICKTKGRNKKKNEKNRDKKKQKSLSSKGEGLKLIEDDDDTTEDDTTEDDTTDDDETDDDETDDDKTNDDKTNVDKTDDNKADPWWH